MVGALFDKIFKYGNPNNTKLSQGNRIGVVDIGSNTVRLVVFDAPARVPVTIFNERVECGLGRGLGQTGLLNPVGTDLAMRTLGRFTRLARQMRVENFMLVATAAIREAHDGGIFVEDVKKKVWLFYKGSFWG